jgi:cation diffusion facilitator family transporter
VAGEESRKAVMAALVANTAIAVGKLTAGVVTGSGVLLAEGGHSVADATNQVFLLFGINLSDTVADDDHPHGYGKEVFFWSFLAAIFMFVGGAAYSFFEGARTLSGSEFHERGAEELALAFTVLGVAFVFEGASLMIAGRVVRRGARRRGWSSWRYLRESSDMTTKTVFWEDSAATLGLIIAALGLGLSEVWESETPDGVASILIGVILTAVAMMIGLQARSLLLGASAHPDVRAKILTVVAEFDEVDTIVQLLTMQLGTRSVLVTGELQLHNDLSLGESEYVIRSIDAAIAREVPEVSSTFWELHRRPMDTPVATRILE